MRGGLLERVPSARLFVGGGVLLGLLVAVATIAQMAALSRIVARVFLGGAVLGDVRGALLVFFGAALARAALLWAREVVAQRGAVRVEAAVREGLFARVLALGPSYAGGERAGELATTLTEGVEKLESYFARYLPQAALSLFVPLLVAAYLLPRDLVSAILLVATAPLIPLMMVLVGSYAEAHMKRQWKALGRLGAHFLDAVRGLTTLKTFGRAEDEARRVAKTSEEFRERTVKVLRYAFLSGLVLEFMTAAAIALVAVTLGVRLVNGNIAFEQAFLVLLLAPEFYKPLRELGVSRHAGMEGKAAAERIGEILETPAPVEGRPEGAGGAGLPRKAGITLEFRGVGYAYPGRKGRALSGVDLVLEAGTRTALVGRSGAGKSTLVDLALRFLDPTEGAVYANGAPVRELAAGAWRENVALVPQRPHLFYGSVVENIRLARPDASRSEVVEAARLAGVDAFVRRLEGGYDAEIGERGAMLSGGEAQRLAIARAFLKDAPLLILDEPTSSLDPESEALIRTALDKLAEGRTTLVVAHRLNTVRGADRIVVLDGGEVAEAGTHAELLARGGAYSRLVGGAPDALPDAVPGGAPREVSA